MKRVIISTLLMLVSMPLLADITASYKIREGGNMQISYRLPAHDAFIEYFNLGSHQLEYIDDAGPGGIDADMF